MVFILFLFLGAAAWLIARGFSRTQRLQPVLQSKTVKTHFPLMVQMLCIAVQTGELVRVVEHATLVNLVGALLILAIVLATRTGIEPLG